MYDYWFDSDGKAHEIARMDSDYILSCLKQLRRMLESWRGIIPEQLTVEELKQKDEVGMKAWFVFNGIPYIDVFCKELDRRENK